MIWPRETLMCLTRSMLRSNPLRQCMSSTSAAVRARPCARSINIFRPRQHWDLVDNDADLLRLARDAIPDKGVTLTTVQLDLNRDLDMAFETTIDLIATSALMDLVSQTWLDQLLLSGRRAARSPSTPR